MKALEGKHGMWLGPVDEARVVALEEALGVVIPPQYRAFLLRYGSGIVGPCEIYGLGGPTNAVPNLQWLVDDLKTTGLHRPAQLLPFYAEGDGDYSAILAAPLAGQPTGAVVNWSPRPDKVVDVKPQFASLEAWFAARVR
jgi:hypothetical protein